jgi:peptidyl-prolyl cis-trans isomerase C
VAACSSSTPDTEPAASDAPASQPSVAAGSTAPPPGIGASTAGLPAAAAPVVPASLPSVVARVNGDEISRTDFEKAVRTLEGRAGGPVPSTERDRIYRQVLDELIAYRLLLQESRSRKIVIPDADVAARLASVRGQFPSEEAFTGMLAQQQLTVEQAQSEMKNELIIAKLLESEIAPKIAVGARDVAAFYEQNPAEFQIPGQVRARHILISASRDADASTRQAARDQAAGLLKRARAGEDFAALAKEFSQDAGSAVSGGDLGFFKPGDMVGPFNDVAFSLAPGAISDLVETDFGYHIITVVEKQAPRSVSLDEARPSIEEYLQTMSRRQHTQAFVQGLRDKGKVDVYI